jgi:hypothetical protein
MIPVRVRTSFKAEAALPPALDLSNFPDNNVPAPDVCSSVFTSTLKMPEAVKWVNDF